MTITTKTRKAAEHKTGYHVYVYGDCYWHRTLDGAERRAMSCRNYCSMIQIIDVATGDMVYGLAQ